MRPETLARIAHPYALESVQGAVALVGTATPYGRVWTDGDLVRVSASNTPWAYAAVFDLNETVTRANLPLLIAITGRAAYGKVAVLFADDRGLIREVYFNSMDGVETRFLILDRIGPSAQLVVRTAELPVESEFELIEVEAATGFDGQFARENGVIAPEPDYSLQRVTGSPFEVRAERKAPFVFGSVTTTESCNLSCVFCHFNGPKAVKKARSLTTDQVKSVLDQVPRGEEIWIAATGELFMDEHALDHLRTAVALGHKVAILSHGQMFTSELLNEILEIGVRTIRMSAEFDRTQAVRENPSRRRALQNS